MSTNEVSSSFSSLGLTRELTDVVTALGYEEPTPVQRATIPLLWTGRYLRGRAGSGKCTAVPSASPVLPRRNGARPIARQPAGHVLAPARVHPRPMAAAMHK